VRLSDLRASAGLAALAAALLASAPGPAAAQLVPRLVDYPVAQTSACAEDLSTHLVERHRVTYTGGVRRDDVEVYSAPGCSAEALLFTISVARASNATTITPTAAGVAFLTTRCSGHDWHTGVAQDVSSDPCQFIAPTLGSL
jgi:hypothetical protein